MSKAKKIIELQFFKTEDPSSLPSMPDKLKTRVIKKGDLLTNGRTVSKYNSVTMKKKYAEDSQVDEILNDFISNYLDDIFYRKLIKSLRPQQTFIRVHIPARSSKLIQDDVIMKSTLAQLVDMELDLDFWFT